MRPRGTTSRASCAISGRAGVDKPEAARARLKVLRDQLTQAMAEFARNIREGSRTVITVSNASDLDGLPADFIARHPPDASGAVTLTTSAVDARPVLTYAKNEELRRRMLVATYNVAAPDNVAVLDRILRVRAEIARLLGYRNWAAYDTQVAHGRRREGRLGVHRSRRGGRPALVRRASSAELARRKAQDRPGSTLHPWDRLYYSELVRRSSYDFDSQVVRPYFPFERVLGGVLRRDRHDVRAHLSTGRGRPRVASVRSRLRDAGRQHACVGRLYLDLHPRANKTASGAIDAHGSARTRRSDDPGGRAVSEPARGSAERSRV